MVLPGCQEHPVVSQTFRKKQQWKSSKQALYWALINLILALTVYCEIEFSVISTSLDLSHPLFKTVEYILVVVFTLNVVVDVFKFLWPRLTSSPVELTPEQQKLLGIKNTEPGFQVSPSKPMTPGSPENNLIFSTSGLSNHSGLSSLSGSPSPRRMSPSGSFSAYSFQASPSLSASTPYMTSYMNTGYSPSSSFAMGDRLDTSGTLRSRHVSPVQRSPGNISSTDRITDEDSLASYLQDQDDKMYRSKLSAIDASMASNYSSSFWNYNQPVTDYSHVLRKYQYQVASRSPQFSSFRTLDDSFQEIPYCASEVFGKFGVTDDDLTIWIENLRRWICLTVVSRLVSEIEAINSALTRIGCDEMLIGEVSVTTLKRLALTKAQYVPSLNAVVPYLDFGSNQEYIVKRIKHLSLGGCMSDYDWNGGGNYGKPWGEHLPTDAALIAHLFCTYLDSLLPADPKYLDGKTFTSQYFLKTPDKPNLKKADNLLLYQAKINPPHFNVVIGEETWTLPKGRNNLFYAILLFLYHIKTKEHGMLGRINLGLSGVNVLWVLDSQGFRRGDKFNSPGASNGI
ncbi:transmembrane protein 209-like [Liolophura sinensis]|uniref:transmembrane protein 209-like n=1 Tax=Liolophura sinensis TaxID=3198878 RepID=UPI0031591323